MDHCTLSLFLLLCPLFGGTHNWSSWTEASFPSLNLSVSPAQTGLMSFRTRWIACLPQCSKMKKNWPDCEMRFVSSPLPMWLPHRQILTGLRWRQGPWKSQPQAASYVWASGSLLPQLLPWVTSFPLITLTHGFLPCLLNDLFMEPRPISKQNVPGELFQNSPHLTTAPFAPDTSAKRSFRHDGETLAKKNYHLFHPWSDTILYIPLLFPLSLPATSAPHFSATVSHRESTLCPLSMVHSVFPTSSPPYHSTVPEYLF